MSDAGDGGFAERLASSPTSSTSMAERRQEMSSGARDQQGAAQLASLETAREDDWHVVEHPAESTEEPGSRAGEASGSATGQSEATEVQQEAEAEGSAAQSLASSRHSGHSFEHLSDHFGPSSAASSRSSFDGVSVSASAENMLDQLSDSAAVSEAAELTKDAHPDAGAAAEEAADAPSAADPQDGEQAPVAADAPLAIQQVDDPANVEAEVEQEASPVDSVAGSGAPSGAVSPVGSSYADLVAALADSVPAADAPSGPAAAHEGAGQDDAESDVKETGSMDVEGGHSLVSASADGGPSGSSESGSMPALCSDRKKVGEEGTVTYMDMLRSAVACVAPTTALATARAWLQDLLVRLRMLPGQHSLHSLAGRLGRNLRTLDRTTLLLGASGIGLVVLSALLSSSQKQNQKLRMLLVERDQELNKMINRVFQLKEALQPRRIPVIHHVGVAAGLAMFPSYPALDIL